MQEQIIGTVELCTQNSERGILRLDLRSDCETVQCIASLLTLLLPDAFDWLGVSRIITKAVPLGQERISALQAAGFTAFGEIADYYVRCRD